MKNKNITKILLFLSIVSIFFNLIRLDIWGTSDLLYLIWNLFLAWIPYVISLFFINKDTKIKYFIPIFLIWLLFLPNTFYLVTDVLHIAGRASQNLWYDSMLFFFFGWLGLLLGIISLFQVHQYIKKYFNIFNSEIIIFLICFISSFGVYLGRFDRWNSWDIFISPFHLIKHSVNLSADLTHTGTPMLFMIIFTMFTYLFYKTIYILIEEKVEL